MMRFTLDQIAAFDSIVRLGSFNAAARQLNLTQPTVSQRIRELEFALGTVLFVRRGPHITLTADGESLHVYARSMLDLSRQVATRFDSGAPLKGNLRFGTTDTFAQICLLEMISRVEQVYPGLQISVCVDNSGALSRLLEGGEVDAAIISNPSASDGIASIHLGSNRFAWVAAASEEPNDLTSPVDLASRHIVVSAPPSILHQTIMGWFAATGAAPGRVSSCNNLSVIVQMVSAGIAVGVLPEAIARNEVADGRLRMLRVVPPLRDHEVSICYRKDGASAALREVTKIVQDLISDHRLFEP